MNKIQENIKIVEERLKNYSPVTVEYGKDMVTGFVNDINGNDLKELGFEQGKIYKEIFEYITEEKINNPNSDKNDEIEWVKERFL